MTDHMVISIKSFHTVRSTLFFFFNDTATTEIYTLSLHDALPISRCRATCAKSPSLPPHSRTATAARARSRDRKSTRLNSSHSQISYAVFCLKKKKNTQPKRPIDERPSVDSSAV